MAGRRIDGGHTIDPLTIVVVAAWIAGFAALAAWLATKRRRSVPTWALFGAILGPVAAVLLWLAPMGHCPTCQAEVRGWISNCTWCGNDVRPSGRRQPVHTTAPTAADAVVSASTPTADPTGAPPGTIAPAIAVRASTSGAGSPTSTDRTGSATARSSRAAVKPSPATDPGTPATTSPKGTKPTGRTKTPRGRSAATSHEPQGRFLASGVFMTGTVGLRPGSRYTLEIDGERFVARGPLESDPNAIVLERRLAGLDATGFADRLVISEPDAGSSGTVLVFLALAGGSPDAIAADLVRSATERRGGTAT